MCMISDIFPGLDLYSADPAQPLTTAGEPDDLDHDLSDLSEVWKLMLFMRPTGLGLFVETYCS